MSTSFTVQQGGDTVNTAQPAPPGTQVVLMQGDRQGKANTASQQQTHYLVQMQPGMGSPPPEGASPLRQTVVTPPPGMLHPSQPTTLTPAPTNAQTLVVTAGTMPLDVGGGMASGPPDFEAHDAVTKTSVSFRAVDTVPTMANMAYVPPHHGPGGGGQNKSVRVCEPFQQGRCRSGDNCNDFHVSPEVLTRFRSTLCEWLGLKETEFLGSQPSRTFRVFCADLKEVVEVPIQALAFTRGLFLDPTIREKRSKNRHAPTSFAVIASQVPTACGLFAQDPTMCKWGKWCNQAHVDSGWLSSRRGEFESWSSNLEENFKNLSSDHEFRVHDPESRTILQVPRAAVTEYTRGLYQGTAQKSPSVCMLYQRGRCTARSRCNQVHLDPQWLALQRTTMAHNMAPQYHGSHQEGGANTGGGPPAYTRELQAGGGQPGSATMMSPQPSWSRTGSSGSTVSPNSQQHISSAQGGQSVPGPTKLNAKARAFVPGGGDAPQQQMGPSVPQAGGYGGQQHNYRNQPQQQQQQQQRQSPPGPTHQQQQQQPYRSPQLGSAGSPTHPPQQQRRAQQQANQPVAQSMDWVVPNDDLEHSNNLDNMNRSGSGPQGAGNSRTNNPYALAKPTPDTPGGSESDSFSASQYQNNVLANLPGPLAPNLRSPLGPHAQRMGQPPSPGKQQAYGMPQSPHSGPRQGQHQHQHQFHPNSGPNSGPGPHGQRTPVNQFQPLFGQGTPTHTPMMGNQSMTGLEFNVDNVSLGLNPMQGMEMLPSAVHMDEFHNAPQPATPPMGGVTVSPHKGGMGGSSTSWNNTGAHYQGGAIGQPLPPAMQQHQ